MIRIATRIGFLFTILFCLALDAAHLSAQNAATSVSVDANVNQHAINPDVYGVCAAGTKDIAALNAPLNRLGGDLSSTYNWQIDTLNLSHDWYWESYLQDYPASPGKSVDNSIQGTHAASVGSEPMVTIPMLPYIATLGPNATASAASLWSFSVAKYGAQEPDGTGYLAADPYQSDAGSGVSAATGKDIVNNPLDAYVPNNITIQKAWLQHLIGKWGLSTTATGVKYYLLDNEPSLWYSTHRDVHPNPETYEELYNDIVANSTAIRAADPNAKIVAPEEWTWWAMYLSALDQKNGTGAGSDYATHNNTYYYPWLLQQLSAYQQANGVKLIDALSVHCYNQTPGGGDDSGSQATRNVETRILWDPNFVDPSWEGTVGINGGVEDWIPTLRNWVNTYYPGLEIGCTEYNWGDETALNGATTQADVEGIYGAYGLDFATRWTVPAQPTYLAMQIYRNYDGSLSTFGNTSVADTVAEPDYLSSYAAVRSTDGAETVMVINKQQGTTPVTLSLANFPTTGTAQAYQISSATQTSITSLGSVTVANNEIVTTVPSQSITLFVIPSGSIQSAPIAPTGLAAAPGSQTVTLTWLATGGATSYSVQRGASSSGPFSPIGKVTSPSPSTFTDTGLTNGATYYYEVSGTNGKGTGPNSAPVAGTPQIPPAFTSSATPNPTTIAASASSSISFTVNDTGGPLANANVEIKIVNSSGVASGYQVYSGQNFAAGGSLTLNYTWDPSSLSPPVTLDGTYTVQIGVFNSTWSTDYYWNNSAATVTLTAGTSPPAFTVSASANPSSITAASASTVSFTVKDTGGALSNANVELQVFNSSNTAVATQVYSAQNFTANSSLPFSYTFTPSTLSPPVTATGTYNVAIGVFNSGWTTDYFWNGGATTITISNSTPAALTSPAAGAQFTGSSAAFSWTAGSGVTNYWLNLGTSPSGAAAKNIYNSGSVTARTETVTGLPTNGETIYATLYSYIDAVWQPTVYTFYAAGPAVLTTPAAGTKLTASSTFTWTPGTGITYYWFNLGTSDSGADAKNLYDSGSIKTLTASVTGIPQYGETLYATLYSYISGAWQPIVYTYTAGGSPVAATLITPAPASKITSSNVTFTWSAGEGVTDYWFNLGTASSGAAAKNIYSGAATTLTSATATGLPTNGETIYATLYSYIGGAWQSTVYTYTAQ